MAEKISEFTCLVRDMREAQKLYFDTRDKAYLKKAREIEKRVDDELQKIIEVFRHIGKLAISDLFCLVKRFKHQKILAVIDDIPF